MFCPYCRQITPENAARCPSCGMDAAGVVRWLGPCPPLVPGLNDVENRISPRVRRKFEIARQNLRHRFRQCDFHWVHGSFDPGAPLALWAFHLFNHGGLCHGNAGGGSNRDALLVTDATGCQACLTIGYGLEPHVPGERLDEVVARAETGMQRGDPGQAGLAVLAAWHATMEDVLAQLPRVFGLPAGNEIEVGLDEPVVRAVRRQPPVY